MFSELKYHYRAIQYKLRTRNRYLPAAIMAINFLFGIPFRLYRLIAAGFPRRGNDSVRKILVIRAEGIGDMVLATPFFKALKKHYPHSHITCLATSVSAEVIRDNPSVDSLIPFDPPWFHQTSDKNGYSQLFSTMRRIRDHRYDMAIDLRANYKNIFFFMFLTQIPRRVSFNTAVCSFLLNLQAPFEAGWHETDNFMNIVEKLGGEISDLTPELFLTEEDRSRAAEFCRAHNMDTAKPRIVFHPGAARNRDYKRWPLQNYCELGKTLIDKYQAKIVITCSGFEYQDAAYLQNQLGSGAAIVWDEIKSLKGVAAVVAACDLCVATSTGMIHLASAVGTPQIVLCGPEDPERWRPLGNSHTLIMKEAACRPCSETDCPRDGYCLKSISPGEIVNHIERVLYAESISS